MSSSNHLEEINKIIQALKDEDQLDYATQLKNAMAGASTGTELIMSVRFYLSRISCYDVSTETMNSIQRMIKHIDTLLK